MMMVFDTDSQLEITQHFTSAAGEDDEYKLKQLTTVVAGLSDKSDAVIAGTKEQLDSFLSDAWGKFGCK